MNKKFTSTQQKAIDWKDGPILIVAGPGSGKTSVLTERVSKLIADSEEDNFKVLGLTFTNKAAMEMTQRLNSINQNLKGRVYMGTFHSFCAEILRNHGNLIGLKPDFSVFSDENDINSLIKDLKKEHYDKYGNEIIYDINFIKAIKYFQENLCFTEDEISQNMPNVPNSELYLWMCVKYKEKLQELNVLDFNSMLLYAYHLFSKFPFIADLYRITYKYICVDEFQDTNKSQYKFLLKLLGEVNPNIFIVADDDQLIYSWNGASSKRLKEFKSEFNADFLQLTENFRCPPAIVEIANDLIENNSSRISSKQKIIAMKDSNEENSLVYKTFDIYKEEMQYICEEILQIREIDKESTIGIISRTNKLVRECYEKLSSSNISAVFLKRKDDFDNVYIHLLHSLLKLVNRSFDEKELNLVVDDFVKLFDVNLDVNVIMTFAESSKNNFLIPLIMELKKYDKCNKITKLITCNLIDELNYTNFIDQFFEWSDICIKENILDLNEDNLNYFVSLYNSEKGIWKDLHSAIVFNSESVPLSAFIQEFSLVSKEVEPKINEVQCMTVHASKGKEFDYVFIIGLVEDEFPTFQSIKKGDSSLEMEEERRNCFVAITRTRKKLYLLNSKKYNNWNKKPSRFIREMGINNNL